MGHVRFHKGRMKGDDPDIDNAQTPKRFDGRLALLETSERLSMIVSRKRILGHPVHTANGRSLSAFWLHCRMYDITCLVPNVVATRFAVKKM